MNVEHIMHGQTSKNWHQRNSNKHLKKKMESVTEKHSISSLQKDSYTGTSHIIQKVLQPEA